LAKIDKNMAKVDKRGRVIAIADYLFANPCKKREDILEKFGKTWQISNRTADRIYREAKDYNLKRVKAQEKIKNEILAKSAEDTIKEAIISRVEAMKILTEIANGAKRTVDDEIIVPSDGDRIRAIQQLAKMEGWESAQKVDLTQMFIDIDTGTDG
jgi:hypothetical protein